MPRARPTVPLLWRVPNAPAAFVGRREELRAIARARRRGPLVVLAGAGGLGKTALAAAAVREVFADRAARAVMVSVRAGAPFRETLGDVVRALGHREPRADADLGVLAIDLAEARRALVVLDDVHHALEEATAMLVAVARYARRAAWIATTRAVPDAPELAGQVVRLEALGEKHLAKLARIVEPKMPAAEAARIAREAAGSPWRARKLASDRSAARVGDAEKSLLATLAVVERPISGGALAKTIGRDPKGAVDDLVRRGLVEAIGGGYRLHEEARSAVSAITPPTVERARTIAALASGGADDALEALRLALESGDDARALAIGGASFDAMLAAGHATSLWKLLAAREDPAWSSLKLRAAVQVADVKVTTLLDPPPRDALRDRLLWVRALYVESKLPAAVAAAEALCADARRGRDASIAFWAALELAMASRVHAGPERGLALLDDAAPIDGATRSIVAALRSFWLAEAGRTADAIATLERTALGRGAAREAPLADEILGGPLDFFVRYYRMAAFMECGELERAHDELTAGRAALDVDDQLRASYVQLDGIANLSIARGKLDDAARILDRLLRGAPAGGSTYHLIARLLDVERRFATGELADVPRALGELLATSRRENPLVHAWCVDTRERLALACATREEAPLDLDASPAGSVARSVLALRRALRRARWGEPHDLPDALDVEGRIVRSLVLATDALVRGDDAIEPARAAVDVAAAHGWGVRECEARLVLAEAQFLAGEPRRALAEARAVARKASTMTSARFASEARALVALFEDPAVDVAALEELALEENVAPSAARRARSLLGDASAAIDAVDARVLSAARASVEIVRVGASGPHRRAWGLDVRRRFAWLPDGRRISLARHALLARVLEVLARRGGVASFEELAREVWGRPAFHPLHDGTRIRVTLHRLRQLVEDDPQRPERIVLGPSSYELGGEPFTLVCAASNAK